MNAAGARGQSAERWWRSHHTTMSCPTPPHCIRLLRYHPPTVVKQPEGYCSGFFAGCSVAEPRSKGRRLLDDSDLDCAVNPLAGNACHLLVLPVEYGTAHTSGSRSSRHMFVSLTFTSTNSRCVTRTGSDGPGTRDCRYRDQLPQGRGGDRSGTGQAGERCPRGTL